MKRILVTSSRAASTLDLIRMLGREGHQIYTAETFSGAVGDYSKHVHMANRVCAPASNEMKYINDLISIITANNIDWLIPTCEEIFYISKHLEILDKHCKVFCSTFDNLIKLHDKWQFNQLVDDEGVHAPDSLLLSDEHDLRHLEINSNKLVFKPIFSRFAVHTIICPAEPPLQKLDFSRGKWLAQLYIPGIEICSYNVAIAGKLTLHVCYRNHYRAGQGAGIYFEAVTNNKIRAFVEKLVAKHNLTGQLSFDFIIRDTGQVYVIECNPRLTSGIHLFRDQSAISHAFTDSSSSLMTVNSKSRYMLSLPMLTYGISHVLNKKVSLPRFISDFIRARCVVFNFKDTKPYLYQLRGLYSFYRLSLRHKISLLQATTHDIEWNG